MTKSPNKKAFVTISSEDIYNRLLAIQEEQQKIKELLNNHLTKYHTQEKWQTRAIYGAYTLTAFLAGYIISSKWW